MKVLWRVTERFRAANFLARLCRWVRGRRGARIARREGILKSMPNAFEFIQQVRSEASRVTWPTRRETVITTIWVLVLAVAASLFLLFVDEGLRILVSLVLGFGRNG